MKWPRFFLSSSLILVVIGLGILLFLPQPSDSTAKPLAFSLSDLEYQALSVTLEDCNVFLRAGEESQILCYGFSSDELTLQEKQNILSLSETTFLPTFSPEDSKTYLPVGLYTYWSVRHSPRSKEKAVEIILAPHDSSKFFSLILHGGTFSCNCDIDAGFLSAQQSEIRLDISEFHRLQATLTECSLFCTINRSGVDFSRMIETSDCTLSLNQKSDVSADFYQSDISDDIVQMKIQGGNAEIYYGE